MDLQQVNQEIAALSITVSSASCHRRCESELQRHPGLANPVATLEIPNNLLILWTRKLALGYGQQNSVFKHLALANSSIKEDSIKISEVRSIEKRLQRERSRIMNRYKRLRKGSRLKFVNAATHVFLFQHETTSTVVVASQGNNCNNGLQLHGMEHT